MTNQYIEREAAKCELLSWAVCMNHPEYLIKDDALYIIDSIPAADVECCGRLRGVTYEDGEVTAVHIRDTDDVVRVFTPVRHGRWVEPKRLYYGAKQYECSICYSDTFWKKHSITEKYPHCPNCGARMDGAE